jgi:hypothetical protein
MGMTAPLMKEAASEARKAIHLDTDRSSEKASRT